MADFKFTGVRMETRDTQVIWSALLKTPGMRKMDILHLTGRKGLDCDTVLLKMEKEGYLLSEDENGRIYPFVAETN
jgi:hypothetical protein